MSIGREAIEALIPHAGAMCLVDEVEAYDASTIVCLSMRHLAIDNPLRRGGRLSCVHAIEFAAQAAALHGALNVPSPATPRPGMLVSVRRCLLHVAWLDGEPGPLRIEARKWAAADAFATYEFSVSSSALRLAEGRLGVLTET